MEVKNCRSCRKLFNYIGGVPICPTCANALEEKFTEVKDYIRKNPRETISAISEENEVSVQQIKQWVREERLSFTEDSPVAIECENCGTIIRTGRYCNSCKASLASGMTRAITKDIPKPEPIKKPVRDKERMRFLDKS